MVAAVRNEIRLRDPDKRQKQALRTKCYDAGYAGRPCPTPLAVCTQAWKRGREARERDAAA
jgi:hypothetical protein